MKLQKNADIMTPSVVAGKAKNTKQYSFTGSRNNKGERNGYGEAILENGDQYKGEYKDGLRNGYGEYTFCDKIGAAYVGHYLDNKKNGYGMFVYADGSRYEGEWKNDKRHGHGIYRYSNGDVYTGEWSMDNRHGQGEYEYCGDKTNHCGDKMKYTGIWRHGKRSGEGRLLFNGNEFIGHFRHDTMLGPGKYIFTNGTEQHGEYVVERMRKSHTLRNENSSNNDGFVTEWRCKTVIGSA